MSTPRLTSHAPSMAPTTSAVVTTKCRRVLNARSSKKYDSMTSRQTNASKGVVVIMLRPKQNLAILAQKSMDAQRVSRMPPSMQCRPQRTVRGKVVQYVACRPVDLLASKNGSDWRRASPQHAMPHKDRIASDGHCQARKHAERHRVVHYPIPIVHGGDLQASKDDEGIVVADCM